MARQSYQRAQVSGADGESHRRAIALVVNRNQEGKLNCVGDVTLTANAASTTVNSGAALLCGPDSFIGLCPLTANAAAALATTYTSARNNGSFVITHANNAQADREFTYSVLG